MPNILITLYSVDRTGAPKMCYYVAKKLREKGLNVVILHGKIKKGEYKASYIYALNQLGCKSHYVPGLSNPFYLVGVFLAVFYILKYKVNYVLSNNVRDRLVGVIAAKLTGIKCFIHCHNQHVFAGNPISKNIKLFLYKNIVVRGAYFFFCVSAIVMDELEKKFGCDKNKLAFFLNGVEISDCPPNANFSDKEPGIMKIVFAGRIDHQKGLIYLFEALKLVKDENLVAENYVFQLAGDITNSVNKDSSVAYKQALVDFVKDNQLEDNIAFLGFVNNIDAVLNGASIYVQPSLFEGLPMAVLEAMNHKLPVIITDGCGFGSEFINGYHGFMVKKAEPVALTAALVTLLNMTNTERATMGTNGYDLLVNRFNVNVTTEKIVQIILAA